MKPSKNKRVFVSSPVIGPPPIFDKLPIISYTSKLAHRFCLALIYSSQKWSPHTFALASLQIDIPLCRSYWSPRWPYRPRWAEFRLPVLVGPLRYSARQAVPLNLAISLVTLAIALVTRSRTLSFAARIRFLPALGALIAGAVITAFIGPAFASRLSEERLERVILVFLVCIGLALMIEGLLPQTLPGFLPDTLPWHIGAGVIFGLAIGLVSSLLGVTGGELIIPTLVFAFGADIKTAGTGSLFVSLPTVIVGVLRYACRGAFTDRQALTETVAPMSVGSLIGAAAGGMLVGVIPASLLKIGLGMILNVSAARIFYRKHASPGSEVTSAEQKG